MRSLIFLLLLISARGGADCGRGFFARLWAENQLTPELRQQIKADARVLKDLGFSLGKTPLLVELPGDGHLLYGTGEVVSLGPNRQLILFRDNRGAVHLIDPELPGTVIFDASGLSPESLALAKRLKKRSGVHVNEKDLKERFCRGLNVSLSKSTPMANRELDRLLAKTNKTRIMSELVKTCATSASAIGAFNEVGDKLFFDDERSNFYAAHRSNFNWGVAGMVVVHNCLATASPSHSKALLALGLGAYVTGNTYFELGLGQNNLDGKTPIKTDPGDFATGTAGILLYALYGRMIERRLDTNFRNFCK